MKVPLLNFVGGPGVPLLNFEEDPGSRVPGSQGPAPTFTSYPFPVSIVNKIPNTFPLFAARFHFLSI